MRHDLRPPNIQLIRAISALSRAAGHNVRMRARHWIPWLLLAASTLGAGGNCARAVETPVLSGVVVGVIDGDTADVRLASGMIRIRFHGIDAPELGQPFGHAAKARLSELVFNHTVSVEPYEQDRYDRLVARLWLGERDINSEMVKSGHAWTYRRYADLPAYCAYEKAARDQRRGLWQAPVQDRIAPWEWRKRKTLAGHYTDYSDESVAQCVASLGRK